MDVENNGYEGRYEDRWELVKADENGYEDDRVVKDDENWYEALFKDDAEVVKADENGNEARHEDENVNGYKDDGEVAPEVVKGTVAKKRRRLPADHNEAERNRRMKVNSLIGELHQLVSNASRKVDQGTKLQEINAYLASLHRDEMDRIAIAFPQMPSGHPV
ncbi:unnamed protein product [Calypogeia fissa]